MSGWDATITAFQQDLQALQALVADPATDQPLSHAQNREVGAKSCWSEITMPITLANSPLCARWWKPGAAEKRDLDPINTTENDDAIHHLSPHP